MWTSAGHTSHLVLLQLPKLADTLEVEFDLGDALVITLMVSLLTPIRGDDAAYRLNLRVAVERVFIFFVDVVELFLCDLNSCS